MAEITAGSAVSPINMISPMIDVIGPITGTTFVGRRTAAVWRRSVTTWRLR